MTFIDPPPTHTHIHLPWYLQLQSFILKAAVTGSRVSVQLDSGPSSASLSRVRLPLPELGAMDDVPPIINISIALRIQPNDGPVFFKVDGTRFGQSRTIKLLTGSKYKIEVVLKPGNVEAT